MYIEQITPVIEQGCLPVSPSTGGHNCRTKAHIIADMRAHVGLPPLFGEPRLGLMYRRTPPTPTPTPTPTPAVPEVYVRVSAAVQLVKGKAAHIVPVSRSSKS